LNIAIIGGTGGMGQIFATELKQFGKIFICSRSLDKAKKIIQELDKEFEPRLNDQIVDADIVIVSVPTDMMLKTCEESLAIMKKGSLLMDLSSVKTGLVDKLKVPTDVEYISCHPLFGPEGKLNGANVIITPIKQENWLAKIKEMFTKVKSVISIIDFDEHDKIMSKIQVMFHFANLCLVDAIAESNLDSKFFSRSFKMAQGLLKNFKSNQDVLFEIQEHNPYKEDARKFYLEIVKNLKDLSPEEFEKKIKTSFSKIEGI